MNKEIEWGLKVIRNGLILAGLYFVSVWGSNETLSLELCKPIIIFLVTYILTEFTKRYGIDKEIYKEKSKRSVTTLIL